MTFTFQRRAWLPCLGWLGPRVPCLRRAVETRRRYSAGPHRGSEALLSPPLKTPANPANPDRERRSFFGLWLGSGWAGWVQQCRN
jgi:hypothetical protein